MTGNWYLQSDAVDYSRLPTLADVDVLIVGGGPAGVAAATTAGEAGLATLLIEKYGFCGGSAVAGMSATFCGVYLANQDNSGSITPQQIVFGFTERFRKKLLEYGGLTTPQIYGNTYVDVHEARVWKSVADEFLSESHVKILYHSTVIGVVKEDNQVCGAVVNSGLGMGVIRAKRIIDCSGDGIVAAMAGANFFCGVNGTVQNPTIIFKLSNVDSDKFWNYYGLDTICHDEFSDLLRREEKEKRLDLPRKKIWVFRGVNKPEIIVNATAIHHPSEKLNMSNPEHFTYAEIAARKQMIDYAQFFRENIPGCEDSFIGETACEVGVRQTRSIEAVYTLKNSDVESCRKFDDGIVKSAWPIELHKGEAPKLHWLINSYYEIPFRTLQPKGIENLLIAGRCLSAEHEALASARVTAQCFEYGRAAAIGVLLSLEQGCNTSEVDGRQVRELMSK